LAGCYFRSPKGKSLMPHDLVDIVTEGLLVVLWYLLRQKDVAQQKSIDLLFKKHDDDSADLQGLKLKIAKTHYDKPELDQKFDRLETAIQEGMRDLGARFDRLSEILVKHISREEK
jgi:hypothetical protein